MITTDNSQSSDTSPSSRGDLPSLYAQLHAVMDQIADTPTAGLSEAELVAVAETHEHAARRMEPLGNTVLADINARDAHRSTGHRSLTSLMSHRLRITEPGRRAKRIAATTGSVSVSGQPVPPQRPALADAVADGALAPGHIHAVLDVLDKIPSATPADVVEAAEATLAEHARTLTPNEITQVGTRLLSHLDPDGTFTEPKDRARQRKLFLGPQDAQLMSRIDGYLDPLTREMLDEVLTVWAARGMNNPDDDLSPRGAETDADPEQLAAAAERDNRTVTQRNHDALHAMLRHLLDGGSLGASHRGLPPHVIVTITERELREAAGFGQTANGNLLPIGDVVELAARAQHHLAVFADHSAQVLYLGTQKRLANRAQRLALTAEYGGCSAPGCNQPASRVEIHHADKDFADGGTTDITTLAPACGPHNRMVGPRPGQYTTTLVTDGPDRGLYAWTLNTEPGTPPNPAHVNHYFRTRQHFTDELARIRDLLPRRGQSPNGRPPDIAADRDTDREHSLRAHGWTINRIRAA